MLERSENTGGFTSDLPARHNRQTGEIAAVGDRRRSDFRVAG